MEGETKRRHLSRDAVMVGLALLSIGILAAQEYLTISPAQDQQLLAVDLAIVGVFWVEYLQRLRGARERYGSRWNFVKANWYELPGMVPILPGMEAFGGVRVLRLLRILRILRLLGALRRFERFDRAVQHFARDSQLGWVMLLVLSAVTLAATLAWLLEPATFRDDFWNAWWWAIVTSTTVGYGDYTPTTGPARMVGVALMFVGVGLIGTLAATLSAFLVERRRAAAPLPAPALPPGFSVAVELERLASLHREGRLSDEEYARAKQRVLE